MAKRKSPNPLAGPPAPRPSYRHVLAHPTFLNKKGEKMPDTGGWQGRHLAALLPCVVGMAPLPRPSLEASMVAMLDAWAGYADAHRQRFESGIGDDGVLGPEWEKIGHSILRLLNGDCGRLDCGTIGGFIRDTLTAEGMNGDGA